MGRRRWRYGAQEIRLVRLPSQTVLALTLEVLEKSRSMSVNGTKAKSTRRASRGKGVRTLVVFLRHFWCPLCQDYIVALARGVGAAVSSSTYHPSSSSLKATQIRIRIPRLGRAIL
jgi:hypothetical protein